MTTLARRRLFSVLLALVAMALVVCALVGFWLWRDGRFLTGTPGRVAAILREVKQEEGQTGTSGLIGRLRYSLPSPLDDYVDRLFPNSSMGEYEFTEQLAALGTNAIPPLETAIEFERSVAARRVSANALASLRATQSTPLLMRILRADANAEVRAAMAQALWDMCNTNAVPALMAALEKDVEPSVHSTCAGALGEMGVAAAGPMILKNLEKGSAGQPMTSYQATMVTALGRLAHAPAVPTLIKILVPPDKAELSTGGNTTYRDSYGENQLRAEAAKALSLIGGDMTLEALVAQLPREKEDPVGEAICEALARLGGPKAAAALRAQLAVDCDFRAAAATALGGLGDASLVTALVALFEDRNDEVRAAAVMAVGVLGDASALESVRRFLPQEPMDKVKGAGCMALALIGDDSDQALVADTIRRMAEPDTESIWAAGYLGNTNTVILLAEFLKNSKDNTARFAAAYGLALVGGDDARRALKDNLSDKDEFARHGKACALLMLGDDGGLKSVRSALQCESDWQRFGAVLAVDRSGLKSTPELLVLAEQDPVEGVRQFVKGAKSGQAPAALIELLKSGNDSYRHYAARALVYYHDTNALPALRAACLDRDKEVREAARLTLRRIEREQSSGHSR
jgi:HEAT repeat protein